MDGKTNVRDEPSTKTTEIKRKEIKKDERERERERETDRQRLMTRQIKRLTYRF